MDPQVLASFDLEDSLSRLSWTPRPLDLVEVQILNTDEGSYTCQSIGTNSNTLRSWLNDRAATTHRVEQVGRLSLILESAQQIPAQEQAERHEFYEEHEMLAKRHQLPVSNADYKHIVKMFDLPQATTRVLCEEASHFQQYRINSDVKGGSKIGKPLSNGGLEKQSDISRLTLSGFTLRMSTKGVLWLDATLSMSYCPSKLKTQAILHGCTNDQRNGLRKQLHTCASFAGHPLLIPVLFIAMKQLLIYEEEQRLWRRLVDVETRSGLTGAPAIHASRRSTKEDQIGLVNRDALGIVQIATYASTHAKALLVAIESMQKSMEIINTTASPTNKSYLYDVGLILSERLTYLEGRTKVLVGDLEFIEKRAQVQITAVYNFLAQSDAHISQRIAKDSRRMAADSGQIARASKRDSSAMKGLAVLTMFFLPGTFLASFFSMPFFSSPQNDNITVTSTTIHLRIFWAVAIPLTVVVLLIYSFYLLYVTYRERFEDRQAILALKSKD